MSDVVSFVYFGFFQMFILLIFNFKPDNSPSVAATPRSNVSSPGPDLAPFEDEGALLGDFDAEMEEEEGEELFGDNMEK